ncbi:SUMF1/EgtB/PvdO family nonheme iron enzyme [Thermodesulfobacteriota bacterium]
MVTTTKASKRLLIIDACRENPTGETRDKGGMNSALRTALAQAEGMATIASCEVGEQSWESPILEQGVFTHFLLKGLRGEAPADSRGFITLGAVSSYTAQNTRDWVKRNRGETQQPWFEGEMAREIPLASSREAKEAIRQFKDRCDCLLIVLRKHMDWEYIFGTMVDEIRKALENIGPETAEPLLRRLETLELRGSDYSEDFALWWNQVGRENLLKQAGNLPEPNMGLSSKSAEDIEKRKRQEIEPQQRVLQETGRGDEPRLVDMVVVPAGKFTSTYEGHYKIEISAPFRISKYEVTQGLWREVIGNNPSYWSNCGDDCPVESVNWWDACYFCNEISKEEGYEECYEMRGCDYYVAGQDDGYWCEEVEFKGVDCDGYRLPTEAEWEYACRAGRKALDYTGNTGVDLLNVGWYKKNSEGTTRPVGQKKANDWGLYDMHGNVWEWCWDRYGAYPSGKASDPIGPPNGKTRVLRGGSYYMKPAWAYSSVRHYFKPYKGTHQIGFRLVQKAGVHEKISTKTAVKTRW